MPLIALLLGLALLYAIFKALVWVVVGVIGIIYAFLMLIGNVTGAVATFFHATPDWASSLDLNFAFPLEFGLLFAIVGFGAAVGSFLISRSLVLWGSFVILCTIGAATLTAI